jgi:rhamnosyltransferase
MNGLAVANRVPRACEQVAAVVVTHNPEAAALNLVLSALLPQVGAIALVDNGSEDVAILDTLSGSGSRVHCIRLDTNLGIAAAQNLGINWAFKQGAKYLLLSDQDSEPATDMVARLLEAATELADNGVSVALTAPNYRDERQSTHTPFMHLAAGRIHWFGCASAADRPEITTAIASGSLIPLSTLTVVGPMRESLFIDLVDIEWCFRARAMGYQAFGVCGATLRHRLGDQPKRLFGRELSTHSPARNYYFYRNAIWLFRQAYVPIAWKRVIARQMLKRFVVFSVLVAPRFAYARMMLLGLWHGLRNRLGPF